MRFGAKIPGQALRIESVNMDFMYGTAFQQQSPDAYERLLLDCMLGDPTLFAREDEVEEAWRFCTAILDGWRAHPPDRIHSPNYEAGTWGPEEAHDFMARDGRAWHTPDMATRSAGRSRRRAHRQPRLRRRSPMRSRTGSPRRHGAPVDDHGSFSIALSGGSTPRLLNEMLAGREWRDGSTGPRGTCTSPMSVRAHRRIPRATTTLAETTLLSRVPIDPGRCTACLPSAPTLMRPRRNIRICSRASLPAGSGGAPRLDVVLLGLGENGHTASLFPGTPALDVTDRWATRGLADYAPFDRITLTYPTINAAAAVGFMVTGAAKHEALAATARGEVPASRVRPADGMLVWFLDAAAAAE